MKRVSGFSFLELLAVVTIIGIVAAVILPRITDSSSVGKEKACYHNRAEINTLVEQYRMKTGNWPANNLSDIGADVNYFPQGIEVCPISGEAYRLDATNHRVIGHTSSGNHSP